MTPPPPGMPPPGTPPARRPPRGGVNRPRARRRPDSSRRWLRPCAPTSKPAGSNGLAVAALVVGIISLIGIFCFGIGGLVLGAVAIVLGVLGLRAAKTQPGEPQKGLAIGGIVMGAIVALAGLAFMLFFFVIGSTVDTIENDGGLNSDPSDGSCDIERFIQDPDC